MVVVEGVKLLCKMWTVEMSVGHEHVDTHLPS